MVAYIFHGRSLTLHTHVCALQNTPGVSAVIIQDFGARRNKDYDFNWSRMTSFEGDTGPYLQYAHTRLCSIERKYLLSLGMPVDTGVIPKLPFSKEGLAVLEEAKALELVLALSHYPDLIAGIPARQFEPNHLVSYLVCAGEARGANPRC